MAEAMIGGMMANGVQPSDCTHVFDVNQERMDHYASRWPGVHGHTRAAECVEGADVVLLAVKPQNMAEALGEISCSLSASALVVSIAAGCPISMFAESLPTSSICRAMPNTPAMIGQGMSVWTCTPACSAEQRSQSRRLLGCFGDELFMVDERYLDMATALVGTGPAYVYMFMEAMVDTGVHMGFPREVAERLVTKTVEGSTAYLKASQAEGSSRGLVTALRNDVGRRRSSRRALHQPARVRAHSHDPRLAPVPCAQITSPGGTTAAAMYSADRGGFRTTIADSIWAAYRRSLELGGSDSNVGPGRARA